MDGEHASITFLTNYLTYLHYNDLRHKKSLLKKSLNFIKGHSINFLKWSPNFNEISVKSLNFLVWITLNYLPVKLCELETII